jgi:hypothetical protein
VPFTCQYEAEKKWDCLNPWHREAYPRQRRHAGALRLDA